MPKLPANFKRSPHGTSKKKAPEKPLKTYERGGRRITVAKPTSRSAWKSHERTVARFFGCERNPLSGRMSRHTASDSIHPQLFIESKLKQAPPLWTLFQKTAEMAAIEGKIPIVALKKKGQEGFLLVLRPEDLVTVTSIYHERKQQPKPKSTRNKGRR